MSASAPQNEPDRPDRNRTMPRASESQDGLLLGLQLCRANTMSLTRLQLALRSGNRRSALEAIDRLHALDARIEHLVERLPAPANEGSDWEAITKHLEDQKIAIAFEKLALASEISGPDMISRSDGEHMRDEENRPASWPFALTPQPVPRRIFNTRLLMSAFIVLLTVIAFSSIAIIAGVP